MLGQNEQNIKQRMEGRVAANKISMVLFGLATAVGLIVLVLLFYRVLTQGVGYLSLDYILNFPAPYPEEAGIYAGLIGSIFLMIIVAVFSIIIGVSTALYLEEYAPKNRFTDFIRVNIQNLAGVPSIVFGLLGLTFFVYMFNFGYTLLAGGLTMALLILPVIVVASQEAVRSVPSEIKEASYGMGASKWQTIARVVLPAAIPGILTGAIIALSRAIGETAPLIIVGAATAIYTLPDSLLAKYTVMPIQIYNWTGRPQEEWQYVAGAGIIILLAVLLLMNSIAVLIRNKYQRRF
ncbi:phosphate ABC transporter permease PstA [Halobacillus litoralis]|uniref:Phosphate transport system permease protein PstA n=1 Tax=Halobacillus litoralis TaxID=45668 RepID=A0A845DTV6_9BACI|nr:MULTISPECIES: phosphate ABC transporter permease PstA [Halobacillus]MCA1021392.1 phosphate ABC transporter permease PstA [Halobacillus litoralis]MYL19782.1 phosphate ABC transporter permease PstA [Halobacillus litoralis]MYL28928.1 phosphate ABC transporter permease PstA [Halobacillus halophilus]MYL37179.1 phosphate ABC transporter permease PstA [Halobacillus litoralis]